MSESSKGELRVANPGERDARLHYEYGRGSAYENETSITRTLDALSAESALVFHDQRMFQILHLSTELAWYNIHFELRQVIRLLAEQDFAEAQRLCERVVKMAEIPISALDIMISSMSQVSLLEFRSQLPPNATGIDSPGMINLRHISRLLWSSFEDALAVLGETPTSLAVMRIKNQRLDAKLAWPARVFDAIQQFDIKLMSWKQLHLRLVWTHLGGAIASMQTGKNDSMPVDGCPVDHLAAVNGANALNSANGSQAVHGESLPEGVMPTSLRGRPISALQKITVTPLFPKLWQIPDLVYQEMTKDGAAVY
jgi:tryptophan 2,3-dioxygenase